MADEIPSGREGARWVNERPSADDFAKWFAENVAIAEGLDHKNYVGGLVLIPAVEKPKVVTGIQGDGKAIIVEREQLSFVPYAKVETRLAYFWDLIDANEEWIGVVEPVESPRPQDDGSSTVSQDAEGTVTWSKKRGAVQQIVEQLPPGFFLMPVPVAERYSHYLCCSYRVAIHKGSTDSPPLREGRGTKMVGITKSNFRGDRTWADENSIMKAETGAIGRALGMAGILVIPGSGVATAEDMIENAGSESTAAQEPPGDAPAGGDAPAQAPAPSTPAEAAQSERDKLLGRAREIVVELRRDFPEAYQAFGEWAQKRRPPVSDISTLQTPALRGTISKLEKLQQEAKTRREQNPPPEAAEPEGGPPAEEPPPPRDPGVAEETGGPQTADDGAGGAPR